MSYSNQNHHHPPPPLPIPLMVLQPLPLFVYYPPPPKMRVFAHFHPRFMMNSPINCSFPPQQTSHYLSMESPTSSKISEEDVLKRFLASKTKPRNSFQSNISSASSSPVSTKSKSSSTNIFEHDKTQPHLVSGVYIPPKVLSQRLRREENQRCFYIRSDVSDDEDGDVELTHRVKTFKEILAFSHLKDIFMNNKQRKNDIVEAHRKAAEQETMSLIDDVAIASTS